MSILLKYFVHSSSAFSTSLQSLMMLSPGWTNAGTRDLWSMFDADLYAHSSQLNSRERRGEGLICRALAHSNGSRGNVSCGDVESSHMYNCVRVHPNAHPQHIKVLNHFPYIQYGCGIQSGMVYSLNHVTITSFGLHLTPIFQHLPPTCTGRTM